MCRTGNWRGTKHLVQSAKYAFECQLMCVNRVALSMASTMPMIYLYQFAFFSKLTLFDMQRCRMCIMKNNNEGQKNAIETMMSDSRTNKRDKVQRVG